MGTKFFYKLRAGLIVLFFIPAYAHAQQLSLQASVDKNTLSLDEQLRLEVIVSGDVSNIPQPKLPDLGGFTAYSSGRSQSLSIINGAVSSSVTFNYVLAPRVPGKHTIPPITVEYKGQTYSTSPIDIEVVPSASSPAAPSQPQPSRAPVQGEEQARSDNLFITLSVDKSKAYVNEQITLTFSFYRRVRLLSQPQYSPPGTTGFWTEDLPPQRDYRTTIQGREYLVTEIKTALFPTAEGTYTIGKATLSCSIEDFSSDDFFGDSFFRGFFSQGKTRVLETKPVTVRVLPLPEGGKPADFNGAVGQFRISANVDKKECKTGDAVTLTVDISGTGNIKTISEPLLKGLDNFKKYETVSSFNLSKENYRVRGSKSYKTVIVPRVSGNQEIPPVRFSYFDPAQNAYRTVSSSPVSLKVSPGPTVPGTGEGMIRGAEGIKLGKKDIRYIKTASRLNDKGSLIYKNGMFLFFQVIPVLGLLVLYAYSRHSEKMGKDIRYARRRRAAGMLKKRLSAARKLLSTKTTKEFYAALSEAVTKYIGDKLNISVTGLVLEQIGEELKRKKADEEIIDEVRRLLSSSDFARFAPSKFDESQLKSDYGLAEHIIERLEKTL